MQNVYDKKITTFCIDVTHTINYLTNELKNL